MLPDANLMPEREPERFRASMSANKVESSALMEDCDVVPVRP